MNKSIFINFLLFPPILSNYTCYHLPSFILPMYLYLLLCLRIESKLLLVVFVTVGGFFHVLFAEVK